MKKELPKKKVLVLGAGASGVAAEKFLRAREIEAVVWDDKDGAPSPNAADFDFCVISPGVSINHPVAVQFAGRIISELALGLSCKHRKVVAVTGTNGKTTVVNMINDAINTNKRLFARRSVLCGNVGVPVTAVTSELRSKVAVTEVSSFMMEPCVFQDEVKIKGVKAFRPNIAMILNISQDHLERHETVENYIACKAAIARNQKKRDVLILNYDCDNTRAVGERSGRQRVFYFSTKARVRGIYIDGKKIILNTGRFPKVIFSVDEFEEEKQHQLSNILASILAAKLLGVGKSAILKACKGGRRLESRIQYVRTVGQVMFFNDSKATNVAACLAACKCFTSPVHLLLGGLSKGQNFDELFEKLPPIVEAVFCFGASASEIEESAKRVGFGKLKRVGTMGDAVRRAFETGSGPRVVLLSPACSSFDEFENYLHRGREFVKMVGEIETNNN